VVLAGAPDSSVPSLVALVLAAGAVAAGKAAASVPPSVGVLVVVASLMVLVGWCFD
jgi:hypothetical protein